MKYTWLIALCVVKTVLCTIEHDFNGFDDRILFGINWPGPELENKAPNLGTLVEGKLQRPESATLEQLKVTSSKNENYSCYLPEIHSRVTTSIEDYAGPNPVLLLNPLFSQKICSYRLESYWSYEVCHGRYVRQYHEERDIKKNKLQEFYLGNWEQEKQIRLEIAAKAAQANQDTPKTTKVEGLTLPYVELVMDDGTLCDLSGKPRMTRVRYVCYSHGKHEIYSFKETSTCEYEIIILSPLLCEHPQFKPKGVSENIIECVSLNDAPKKPRDLLKMEAESLKFHHQSIRQTNNDKDLKDILAVLKVEKIDKDGETHLTFELHPLNDDLTTVAEGPQSQLPDKSTPVIKDDSPVRAFLNGENCLNGGTGWWKYEFCYGKHVEQYHVDRTGQKTSLLLGRFDERAHLDWIAQNKAKAPKPTDQRASISHFYSNGDLCDKTGKPRQTEVKLKCLENSSSPAQVSLYLLEPRTCHYVLGVESPLICDILPLADENGLIKQVKPLLVKQENLVEVEDDNDSKPKELPQIGND